MLLFWGLPALGVDVGIGVVDVIIGGAVSPNVVWRENVLFVSRPSMDRKTLAVVFDGEPVWRRWRFVCIPPVDDWYKSGLIK